MSIATLFTALMTTGGLIFFIAGSVGMLRFPDQHSRLHAMTKADNLGLGMIVLGAMAQAGGPLVVFKLALIWILAVAASAVTAQTIARATLPGQADPEA
ncbi:MULTISPECIES: monovalent cation/H(+) antiporter subunit G [unclassified Roseitalea]|uniref:cation:proton antiporter n=1 Tax=unclassified Roseitalea TaxID=2639107 RepID=UPI0027402A28|nr:MULTISPECIES: monovalent cation/H(+) antiporter subunit G [unclassified Roseitalea]